VSNKIRSLHCDTSFTIVMEVFLVGSGISQK